MAGRAVGVENRRDIMRECRDAVGGLRGCLDAAVGASKYGDGERKRGAEEFRRGSHSCLVLQASVREHNARDDTKGDERGDGLVRGRQDHRAHLSRCGSGHPI